MTPKSLKRRRLALGLLQKDLAKRLGVSQAYVSYAERVEGYARPWYPLALSALKKKPP